MTRERNTAPPATESFSPEATATSPQGEKVPRLLIAEDHQVVRQVLETLLLQRSNYAFDFAEDGQKAVEMWESGEYDLILMDIQMPRLNGFEATAAIRKKERSCGGHIPIIAVTAHDFNERICLAAGMDAYLSKPVDFPRFLVLIRDLLKLKSGDVDQ